MTKLYQDILALLKEDARMPISDLATMLGADEEKVKDAIADMEKQGVIAKYTIIVNDEKCEKEGVEALIEVKVSPVREKGFDEIAQYIYQFDEVKSVYLMSGAYDLAVFIEDVSLQKVARFVSEHISTFNGVISTATHFILKKYKVEGILTEKDEDRRISIQA